MFVLYKDTKKYPLCKTKRIFCYFAICLLYTTVRNHRVGYLHKTTDICTLHIVYIAISLRAILHAHLVYILHYRVELLIDLLFCPLDTHRVLRHLQARSGYTSCIRCLTRSVEDSICKEDIDSLGCRRHICTLGNALTTVVDKLLSLLAIQLILRSARQCDIALNAPRTLACKVFCVWILLAVLLDATTIYIFEQLYIRQPFPPTQTYRSPSS